MSKAHILVVDDERDIRNLVKEILEDEGYEVTTAEGGEAARKARQMRRPDLVLLDIWMPDIDGISLLKEWSSGGRLDAPVIMISGHATVETAVEATRLGAYDFLEKPLSLAKLLLTVRRALEADRMAREIQGLRAQAEPVTEPTGKSDAMRQLREQLTRIAGSDAWVMIRGEPGSGKKVCARFIHANSARADGPFVEVGVGSITRENAAKELFGAEESGVLHYGRLERANGGTLLFDEIFDMDSEIQLRLLGALQTRSFLRVGGSEPVHLNVRIVTSTQWDLAQALQSRRLREDLYYQLNVVPVRVPPLRERKEDVSDLLTFYVNFFVQRDNLAYREFTVGAQNRLRNYPWPGNIRELKNLVQRLLILGAGSQIDVAEVDAALGAMPAQTTVSSGSAIAVDLGLPLRQAREQFERLYFEHQLQEANGAISLVAKNAGVERTHLYRKLRALGISLKEEKA
jgi:DNA-binding NtrC family response regulator